MNNPFNKCNHRKSIRDNVQQTGHYCEKNPDRVMHYPDMKPE